MTGNDAIYSKSGQHKQSYSSHENNGLKRVITHVFILKCYFETTLPCISNINFLFI